MTESEALREIVQRAVREVVLLEVPSPRHVPAPPHDLRAERALAANALCPPMRPWVVSQPLDIADFYSPLCGYVWAACQAREGLTPALAAEVIVAAGHGERKRVLRAVLRLVGPDVHDEPRDAYVARVRSLAARRRLIAELGKLDAELRTTDIGDAEVYDRLRAAAGPFREPR